MVGHRRRQSGDLAVGDGDLEADLALLIAAFRHTAHPLRPLSWEAGPADESDSAKRRVAIFPAPIVLPSRRDAWGSMFEAPEA